MKLIDVFQNNNRICLWKHDKKKNHFEEEDFMPKIYVLAKRQHLTYLKEKIISNYEIHKTLTGKKQVLAIETEIKRIYSIVRYINQVCKYECEIFNSDIPVEEYYLFTKELFPTYDLESKESPYDEYEIPKLKIGQISARTSYPIRKDYNADLICIYYNKIEQTIEQFINEFQKQDPDIIITDDNLLLPYLLEKIRKQYPEFSFSRFGKDSFRSGGSSYFAYNRYIYKTNSVYLKGRLHFNIKGLLYGNWDLTYPFELARITRTTLQRANHRSVGYCISNLQLYYAMKHNFLIPRTASCAEKWKTAAELFNADRGALTLEPIVGHHENIAELDFASLYPSIMAKYNISTETLYCKCCKDNKVPGLNINICTKEKGIMPEMLTPIIEQREYYKSTGKEVHKARAEALKGLLVTCFGYMGFRKSKFARIEAHQSILAYARETLLNAIKISEEQGYEVIHGIVDSIWVKKENINRDDLKKLIEEITRNTGLKIKLEGIYRWIVFLPSVNNQNIPVPTRYYGVFENNEIKARGIELRRHDSPEIVKEMQGKIVNALSKAEEYEDFARILSDSEQIVNETITRIAKGYVDEQSSIIKKRISKTEYKSKGATSVIVNKLKKAGYVPHAGDAVAYVIADRNSKSQDARYNLAGNSDFRYDKNEYSRLARKAYRNLFPGTEKEKQLTISQSVRNEVAEVI